MTTKDKLLSTLLVPALIGEGNNLYPFANGSNIILSNAWLKANTPLLIPSKQSFTSPLEFFDKLFSPSLPARDGHDRNREKNNNF